MKKILIQFLVVFGCFFGMAGLALAGNEAAQVDGDAPKLNQQTLIPQTSQETILDCQVLINQVHNAVRDAKERFRKREEAYVSDVLGCAIRTGDISLWMIPYYIRYILQFMIGLSGFAAMGAIIYGGYLYVFSGLSEDKETAKKSIKYGIIGIMLVMLSWFAVNAVVALFTI